MKMDDFDTDTDLKFKKISKQYCPNCNKGGRVAILKNVPIKISPNWAKGGAG